MVAVFASENSILRAKASLLRSFVKIYGREKSKILMHAQDGQVLNSHSKNIKADAEIYKK